MTQSCCLIGSIDSSCIQYKKVGALTVHVRSTWKTNNILKFQRRRKRQRHQQCLDIRRALRCRNLRPPSLFSLPAGVPRGRWSSLIFVPVHSPLPPISTSPSVHSSLVICHYLRDIDGEYIISARSEQDTGRCASWISSMRSSCSSLPFCSTSSSATRRSPSPCCRWTNIITILVRISATISFLKATGAPLHLSPRYFVYTDAHFLIPESLFDFGSYLLQILYILHILLWRGESVRCGFARVSTRFAPSEPNL